jgi:predicted nuclease of restriction endonuclease-like (RecB) superfamily
MVQFAKEYPEFAISQQVVGQIPWGHNILLLQKLETPQTDSGMPIKQLNMG